MQAAFAGGRFSCRHHIHFMPPSSLRQLPVMHPLQRVERNALRYGISDYVPYVVVSLCLGTPSQKQTPHHQR